MSDHSKRIYALQLPPGTEVEHPEVAFLFDGMAQGFENFGVVRLRAIEMESLQLQSPDRADYHVRARWNLGADDLLFLAP